MSKFSRRSVIRSAGLAVLALRTGAASGQEPAGAPTARGNRPAGPADAQTGNAEAYVPGSIQVSITGNDANNGIPVGETGYGGYLNGVAGTGPKRSLQSVLDLCEAGRIAKPYRIYLRDDTTHRIERVTFMRMGGSNDTVTPEKVQFLNYPGEVPTISVLDASPRFERGSGYGPWAFTTRNWRVRGCILEGSVVIYLGGTGSSGGPCNGFHLFRCRQTSRVGSGGRDNAGVVSGEQSNCADVLIEECDLLGSLVGSDNMACLYWDRTGPGIHVKNCRLNHDGRTGNTERGRPIGHTLHHKYSSASLELDEFLYENCLITNDGGRSEMKNSNGTSMLTHRNNIWWHQGAGAAYNTWGQTGGANLGPVAYRLRFFNDGFYRSDEDYSALTIWITDNLYTDDDGRRFEAQSCEIVGRIRFSSVWSGAAYAEEARGDHNVVGNRRRAGVWQRGETGRVYSLSAWQSYNARQGAGFDDANSVTGPVAFVDGARRIDDPLSFRRHPSSPKFGMSGPDIGLWRRWAGAGEGGW